MHAAKASKIKASLAQLSQRCNVMLIKLADEEIRHHTRRIPDKKTETLEYIDDKKHDKNVKITKTTSNSAINDSIAADSYKNESMKSTSYPVNTSASLRDLPITDYNKHLNIKTPDSRSGERYEEVFGSCHYNNSNLIKKQAQKRLCTNESTSHDNASSFVSTTVNVNICNTPSRDIQGGKIKIKRGTNTDNNFKRSLDACHKRLRIDVSLSVDGSNFHEELANSTKKRNLKTCNLLKKSVKKSRTSKKSKVHMVQGKSKTGQCKVDKSIPSPLQNENSEDDTLKKLWKMFGVEPPMDRSENIIKSYSQSLDATGITTSRVELPNSLYCAYKRKVISTQLPTATQDSINCRYLSTTKSGAISLSDDNAKMKNEKINGENDTANNFGTIRVKSLGQLLDPKKFPKLSHPGKPKSQSRNSLDIPPTAQINAERSIEEVFMSLYKTHFDEHLEAKLLTLGEILHLAISDDMRRKGRIKRAKQLWSPDLIHEEVERADRDFMEMVKIRSVEFAPLVDLILKQFEESSKVTMFFTLFSKVFEHAKQIDPENGDKVLTAKRLFHMMIRLTKHSTVKKALLYNRGEFMNQLRNVSILLQTVYKKYPLSQNESSKSKGVVLLNSPENSLTQVIISVPRDDSSSTITPETINANSESIDTSANHQVSRPEALHLIYTHPSETASLHISSAQRNFSNLFEKSDPPNSSPIISERSGISSNSIQQAQSLNPLLFTNELHANDVNALSTQPEKVRSPINISCISNKNSYQPVASVSNSQWNWFTNGVDSSKSYDQNLSHQGLNFPNNEGSLLCHNNSKNQLNIITRNNTSDHRVGTFATLGKSNERLATDLKGNGGNLSPPRVNLFQNNSTTQQVSSESEQNTHKPLSNLLTYASKQLLNTTKYHCPDTPKQQQPNSIASPPTTQINTMERKSPEQVPNWLYKPLERSTPMTSVKNATLSGNKQNVSIGNVDAGQFAVNQHIFGKPYSRNTPIISSSEHIINSSSLSPSVSYPDLGQKLRSTSLNALQGIQPQANDVNTPATTTIFCSKDNLAALRYTSNANENLTTTNKQAVENVTNFNNCTMPSSNSARQCRPSVVVQYVGRITPDKITAIGDCKQLDNSSYPSSTDLQSEILSGTNTSSVGSAQPGLNTSSSAVATGLKAQDQTAASKILPSSNHSAYLTLVPNGNTNLLQNSAISLPFSRKIIQHRDLQESRQSTSPSSITENWISSQNVMSSPMKPILGVFQHNGRVVPQPAVPTIEEGGWGPQQLTWAQYHPQSPGLPTQYHPPQLRAPTQNNNTQSYPSRQPQNYGEPPQPMSSEQNKPVRRVTFSENSHLVTVENQHFHPPDHQSFDPGYKNESKPIETQPYNSYPGPSPEFNQQTFPWSNLPPSNIGYPHPSYEAPPNALDYQNYNPNNLPAPGPVESQQSGYYPPNQPQPIGLPVYQPAP